MKYAYFGLCLPFIFVWLLLFFFSPKTRAYQIKLSLAKIPFGPMIDMMFFTDYWSPESILSGQIGSTQIMLESMLFAFFFGGIAATIYRALFHKKEDLSKLSKSDPLNHYFVFFMISFILIGLGMNSIFATALGYGSSGVIMILKRKASFRSALFTSFFMTTLLFIVYLAGRYFIFNSETILRAWWMLYGTGLDVRFMNIPLTEIIWAICYGFTAGARHNPKETEKQYRLNFSEI